MSKKAFIDTTLIVEALLKTKARRKRAKDVLNSYSETVVPVYAFKEMKAGALAVYIWLHNKLATTKSLQATYASIHVNFRARYRVGTSLEALQVALEGFVGSDLATANSIRDTDRLQADLYRYALRRIIVRGWKGRRSLCSQTVNEAACFDESAPYYDETLNILEHPNKVCGANAKCSLARQLKEEPLKLMAVIEAIKESVKPEDVRRRKALRILNNTPKRDFSDPNCRNLGDAYFALTCPDGFCILTSNIQDHERLATPLGVKVEGYAP